jgi:hypothetical protein
LFDALVDFLVLVLCFLTIFNQVPVNNIFLPPTFG